MHRVPEKKDTGASEDEEPDTATTHWLVSRGAAVGSDPDGPPLPPGELVAGRYALDRVLASGGMGVVWLARHVELEQLVAIKFLRRELVKNGTLVTRFLEEARAAAALRSEHVVRVIDVGVLDSGVPYFIMEYLDGTDLETVVREKGPLDPERAIDFALQACDALIEAHRASIVHRDVKPENLFVIQRPGRPPILKVVDFGIAKRLDPTRARVVTAPQDNMGSPCYMSPEQMSSPQAIDARTDIWSLGVVLYQLLTAQLPFDGETVVEVFARVVNAPARPLYEMRPEIDAHLDGIVRRCLEKEPDARFQSVSALADALRMYRSAAFTHTGIAAGVPLWDRDTPPASSRPSRLSGPVSFVGTVSDAPVALSRGPAALVKRRKRRTVPAIAGGLSLLALSGLAASTDMVPGLSRFREHVVSWLLPPRLAPDGAEHERGITAHPVVPYVSEPMGVVSPDGSDSLGAVPELGDPADESDENPGQPGHVEPHPAKPGRKAVLPRAAKRAVPHPERRGDAFRIYIDPPRSSDDDVASAPGNVAPRTDAPTQIAAPRQSEIAAPGDGDVAGHRAPAAPESDNPYDDSPVADDGDDRSRDDSRSQDEHSKHEGTAKPAQPAPPQPPQDAGPEPLH